MSSIVWGAIYPFCSSFSIEDGYTAFDIKHYTLLLLQSAEYFNFLVSQIHIDIQIWIQLKQMFLYSSISVIQKCGQDLNIMFCLRSKTQM